jgi:hypothetical protein
MWIWSPWMHRHLVCDSIKKISSITFYSILLKQESEFSIDFARENFMCTWTIPYITMVVRWPMNLTIWNLIAFLIHLIRQAWARATFGHLECWSRKSRIGCFKRLKKLWQLFTGYGTSWP